MRLQAGKLRHSIKIQENVGTSQDENHRTIPDWVTRVNCKAEKEQLSAVEGIVFDQNIPTATYRFRTHYFTSAKPNPTWRIVECDQQYEIIAINNVGERNEVYEFVCGNAVTL